MVSKIPAFICVGLLITVRNSSAQDLLEFLIGPRINSRASGNAIPDEDSSHKLVKPYGYRIEIHQVTSETGHIITLHRLLRSSKKRNKASFHKSVLLIHHGVLASSDVFLLRGPRFDVAYMAVNAGHDVWLINSRGNCYSRKHESLDPDKDPEYWNFSIDETGYYDLPAAIDHILLVTNRTRLSFMGHSIGATAGFIMCSLKPDYNEKIQLFIALGPLATIKHTLSPAHFVLFRLLENLMPVIQSENILEVLPRRQHVNQTLQLLCQEGSTTHQLCFSLIFAVVGPDYPQLNVNSFLNLMKYYPTGTSGNVVMNIVQYYLSGEFAPFSKGTTSNKINSSRRYPVKYDLSKVTTPVSLHYGPGDVLVTKEDISQLEADLPNVVGVFPVPWRFFNHLDFLVAKNLNSLLSEQLIVLLSKFE